MLPYLGNPAQDRLGIVVLGERTLGNPVQLGAPLALALLLLLADRGRWVVVSGRAPLRAAAIAVVTTLLFLTTSRAAWAIAAAGLLVIFLFGARNRASVVAAALAGVVLFQAMLLTPVGGILEAAVARTFGEDRSASGRTSGRSDQWVVTYFALTESATSLLVGHGPGRGPAIYARKSIDLASVDFEVGREMALHSMFMQLLVEAGLLGFLPLVLWLAVLAARAIRWARRRGELMPALAVLSFLILASTVSAMDTVSGVFVGIGLLAASSGRRQVAAPAGDRRALR
jgi:O-antigen ligase